MVAENCAADSTDDTAVDPQNTDPATTNDDDPARDADTPICGNGGLGGSGGVADHPEHVNTHMSSGGKCTCDGEEVCLVHVGPRSGNPPNPPNPPDQQNGVCSSLTDEHAEELRQSAISVGLAKRHGVYSALTVGDLPEPVRWIDKFDGVYPVLVYPMTEPDGSQTCQVKPQPDTVPDGDGGFMKYVSPKGGDNSPQLPVIRTVADPKGCLFVEGVKQALAADAWAPEDFNIYRICGITGWMRGGAPVKHLKVAMGLPAVVVPDSDAARKQGVFDGATAFGKALGEWTEEVCFVQVSGAGNTGIDDRLGDLDVDEERRHLFRRWIETAKSKPAAKRPTDDPSSVAEEGLKKRSGDRPVVRVDEDILRVIEEIHRLLRDRFDGIEMFRHGETLARLVHDDDGPTLEELSEGAFYDLVAQVAQTVKVSDRGVVKDDWPHTKTLKALVAKYREYTRINGVSQVPVVRPDGTIVTESGLDPVTGLYVHLSDDLQGLDIPDHPTQDDIVASRSLLTDDLLVDFPLKEQCDRAHAIAGLLTPIIRSLVPIAPICVFDGLTSRVGKGLLLECFVRILAGHPPNLTNLPKGDEQELRKLLTSMLLAGQTLIIFDEAHVLESEVLCQMITAQIWSDRLLGGNQQARLKNVASTFTAGNKVKRNADIANRAYSVRLHTTEPNPQNRSGWKHDPLPDWVMENRAELLRACLILVRAWFDQNRPEPIDVPTVLGGFEKWRSVVGGILEVAGIDGFLESVDAERMAADFAGRCNTAFVGGLANRFGIGVPFTTKQVGTYLTTYEDAEAPYGLESLTSVPDNRVLGRRLGDMCEVWFGDCCIVQLDEQAHGSVAKWMIREFVADDDDDAAAAVVTSAPTPPTPLPVPVDSSTCSHCGGPEELIPPMRLIPSCPGCYPGDFPVAGEEVA